MQNYKFIKDLHPFKVGDTINNQNTILGDNPDPEVLSTPESIQHNIDFLLEQNVIVKIEE